MEMEREYKIEFSGLLQITAKNDKEAIEKLLGMVTTEDIYTWKISEYLGNGETRTVEEL
ncbi:MAG: hypothetical protein IJH79_20870 [Lentisphaeria bacterium]|nr:hypothetical protein [Lentisphaeria bacterium]